MRNISKLSISLEIDIEVRSIAERLVLGSATAAERVMFFRFRFGSQVVFELNASNHVEGSILGHDDRRLPVEISIVPASYLVTQSSRRALPDGFDDLLDASSIGIDPGAFVPVKHTGKTFHAGLVMGTDTPVIHDCDLFALVLFSLVRHAIGRFVTNKFDSGMTPITVRLIL